LRSLSLSIVQVISLLDYNNLSDDGAINIALALRNNKTLKKLYLGTI